MFSDKEKYYSQVREVLDLRLNHGLTYKEIALEVDFTVFKVEDIIRRFHLQELDKEIKLQLTPFEERMKPYYEKRGIKARQDALSE